MSLGEGLRTLRKEMGKSIRVISGLAGVSYGNLCQIENDKQSAYISTIKVIAESTGMDIHRLAHYAFDLSEPEFMDEISHEIKGLCDRVMRLSPDERRRLTDKMEAWLEAIQGGGGPQAKPGSRTGYV